jgi:EAL domain-containing protein (putative c-di-GMP-specific phosphodiesterase class I)
MYSAKSNGKGHAEVFAPEMLRAARRRIRIENELATAIEEQQLEAHYQPIVDLGSRHLVGVEALMRWRHPTRGLVMPSEFIPLAEETGQIVQMTQWMLNRACADVARLQKDLPHGTGLRVSVNVSSRYLNHGHVAEEVKRALETHGIAADSLILEVTESLLLENTERLERIFRELKLIGVRLALDDFGTGYSSISYLHAFPFDMIKIDRSFVSNLDHVHSKAILRGVVGLARGLELPVTAEGVETQAQLDVLAHAGCDFAQGFLIGRPASMTQYAGIVGRPVRRERLASRA